MAFFGGILQTACHETKSKIHINLGGFGLFPQATLLIHQRLMLDSFLGDLYLECGYEDLPYIRKKTNMPEEKQIRISSTSDL